MNEPTQNLKQIQRWMHAVITHPDGIEGGIHSNEAQQQVPVDVTNVERVISRSQALDSVNRLRVYGNAYFARLVECLENEYPSLVHAVGQEAFDGFAFEFLNHYPSTSYTLNQLGAKFPQYLTETRPEREEGNDGEPDWADWMIDLARLERAYSEVFDGPGVEKQELLKLDDLQNIAPEQMADIRLIPVPCLRLMSFQFPVHEYVSAFRQDQQPEWPAPSATYLAITRRNYIVRRHPIDLAQYTILNELMGDKPLGQAIETVVEQDLLPANDAADNLRLWFESWSAAGFFYGVELTTTDV